MHNNGEGTAKDYNALVINLDRQGVPFKILRSLRINAFAVYELRITNYELRITNHPDLLH